MRIHNFRDNVSDGLAKKDSLQTIGRVCVQTKDGSVYEGIFHTWDGNGRELNIALRFVYHLKGPKGVELPRSRPVPSQVIFSKDLVSLDAKDVKLGGEDIAPLETQDTSFLADSEISGSRGMYVTGNA